MEGLGSKFPPLFPHQKRQKGHKKDIRRFFGHRPQKPILWAYKREMPFEKMATLTGFEPVLLP